jgi:hypothetical protein
MRKINHVIFKRVVTCSTLVDSLGALRTLFLETSLLLRTRNLRWPQNVALSALIYSLPLPFLQVPPIQRAKLFRPILHAVRSTARMGRRGTLSNHSILMSLIKGLQLPVLSLRGLLRSLLMYDPKRARNPQYAYSPHPNHVRKLLCSSPLQA